MAVVCAVLFGVHFYSRVDEKLRTHVENLLANQYPGLDVSVKYARLVEREGFRIGGVSFVERSPEGAPRDLAFIDEILVRCKPTLDDLLRGHVEVAEIVVRHASLRSTRNVDGSWSIQHFAKLPRLGGRSLPTVVVEDAALEIFDASRRPSGLFTLRDIQFEVRPELPDRPAAGTTVPQPILQIEGSFTGDHLQRTVVQGVVDPDQRAWRFVGQVAGLSISPALAADVPTEVAKQLELLGELQAHCAFTFDVTNAGADLAGDNMDSLGVPHPDGGVQFAINGTMIDGRLTDPALSLPLTDLAATFSCDNQDFRVENVTGRFGEAVVHMSCRRAGLDPNTPLVIEGNIDNIRLDRGLVANLPPSWQEVWDKFRPQGHASAEFKCARENGAWNNDLTIHCHDVGFTWDRFPYPVETTTGVVRVRPQQVDFDLRSTNVRQPLRMRGEVMRPGKQWYGWLEAVADKAIPLDERLIGAASAKTQRIVRSFSPHGLVTFNLRVSRRQDELEPSQQMDMYISQGSVRHEKFPYPLHNVSARIERRNDRWVFRDVVGSNDSAQITCQGTFDKLEQGGTLRLRFVGTDVPLEEELRAALSPPMQTAWRKLQPQGTLDHVTADLHLNTTKNQENLVVTIEERNADNSDRAKSLSIRPEQFPFRVDGLTGVATFENGRLQLHKIRGQHEGIRVAANGNATISADRSWALNFDQLTVDRLKANSEFTKALPPALRQMLTQMQVGGTLWLDGALSLAGRQDDPDSFQAGWRMLVNMEDATFELGSPLEHVSGQVTLQGNSRQGEFACRGELDIDSLMVNGTQLTSVRGPIWIDPTRLLAGAWAGSTAAGAKPRSVESRVFGGTLQTDFQAQSDAEGRFDVRCRLFDADVSQIHRHLAPTPVAVRGRAWADLQLSGNRQGRHAHSGTGSVQLRETNLYELPFFLSLFKTMRTGSTDRTAFNASDAKFRLQGDHIYFDRLDLQGDTLTLKGIGEMNRNRDLKLDFYTVVGREDAYLPALRPLLGMASRRFLVVKVTGNLDNPQMSREVLPGINDTLRQLFPEEAPQPAAGVVKLDPIGQFSNAISRTSATE